MANVVQNASGEHFQTASEGTNMLNSSELRVMIERNKEPSKEFSEESGKAQSSEVTNPFTSNELRANVEHYKQQNHPADGEEAWPGGFGATNPFPSGDFTAIPKPHKYNTRSKGKLGTGHAVLQGPILEPGRPSKRDRSVHRGDPSKKAGDVDNVEQSKPDGVVGYGKSSQQAHVLHKNKPNRQNRVLENGESSKQGARGAAQAKGNPRTTHDTNTDHETSDATQAGPSVICRQSITRAILKLGTEGLIKISTETIGMSPKCVVHSNKEHSNKEFTLTQSHLDFGIKLHVARLRSDQQPQDQEGESESFHLHLYFDPNSDSIWLANKAYLSQDKFLTIEQLPNSSGKVTYVLCGKGAVLEPSSYRLTISDGHIFDITLLPRHYAVLKSGPDGQSTRSVKRTHDVLSQQADPSVAKRMRTNETNDEWKGKGKEINDQPKGKGKVKGKGKGMETNHESNDKGKGKATADASNAEETTDEPNASTITQTRSPSHDPIPASTSPFPSSSDLRAGYVSAVNHPLEQLQQNSAIKIANATRGEDYTLVRRDKIADQDNTLVFKAHHSKISRKLVAVKVWRSTLDRTSVASDASVKYVPNVSKYFLNELKNHLKVSEHDTIATLHSFDVRLLALYIEHIDAPSLALYRDFRKGNYCTLHDDDAERVLRGMVGALEYIHDKDVVHNDIKPANILYSKERGPVLIDFGWSSDAKTVHTAGSPWYIPPEYPRYGTRGPAGDVFALGVVMLYLMRKFPLPDSLWRRLCWQIYHLRSMGPESQKAIDAMNHWLGIVEKASEEVESDKGSCGILKTAVPRILERKVEDRLTAREIISMILERAE